MRKSVRILFTIAALAIAVSSAAGKDEEVNFKYDKLLKKSFDELGDGSIVPVTVETATEIDGTLSSDGQYMFYSSDRERGNFDIYLRSMTDITTVRVTSHPSKDVSPAVSPDGKRLAFVSFREDPLGDIYVMNTDPAAMIESASDPDAESFDRKAANISMIRDARGTVQAFRDADPAWSPDGKNVVFSSTRNGGENLFICDKEGMNLRQLTTKGGTTPRYSEDGTSIVFVSYRDNASGDIYVLDPASGKETRVTDEPGVKLYPSFGKTAAEITYTLIDSDTDRDGRIDFKDRSVLMYMNTARKISYQLTLGSVSSFRGRFFPVFQLSYTTKEINYQGVILYSEQSGNNININIIPEYGVIPKRKTEEMQYSLAEDTSANQEEADRVILSYLRVYQFYPVNKNPSPVSVRALFRAAIGYRDIGDMKSAAAVASKLRSLSKSEDDYCGVKARILDATLAGKDPGSLYQKGITLVTDVKTASFMREDAADYWLSKGDSAKAGSLYRSIIESDEKFRNIAAVKYQLGLIESGKGLIPSTLIDVFRIGRQTQKDRASLTIVSILAREKNARKRIGMIEDFRARLSAGQDEKDKAVQAIMPVLAYAEGVALVEAGDSANGAEWIQTAIKSLRTTELMYYEANLRMAEISAKKGDSAGEEKYLSLIANNYLPRWNRPDFGSVINRLIAYYENTGANLESTGKYDKAAEQYTRYIRMLTYLHLKKKFEDVYNEYAPRAHVLYIDSFVLSKSDMFVALSTLEKQYLDRLPIARLDFDKAFIYGLGYIYAKRGAEQERLLDGGALTVTEGAFTESYLSAQTHLAWAFFMDDTFVDPYLLQGWINQAIDLRRVKLQNQNAAYKLWKLNKSFPPYLWERNKSVYEKGLEAADASRFSDKSGSLHLNLGNTYFLLSNYPLALEHYEAAARLKTGFGSRKEESLFRYHLSYCYWQTGKTVEAKREMLRVYDAYSQLASSSTGRQYAEQLTNIDEYMAMYERTLGNFNESIKWHERAISDGGDRLRSDISRITLEIAWCAMKAGDYSRAYRMCSKAEEMLSREPADDQEFILRLYLFHVIGINFWDLGPDKVVIGDSRIFSHLSVMQKKLFLFSIREELGIRKGDYAAVSAAINAKIAILKGRATDADKDALIRAYNGVGNSLFRLGRYSEARNHFEKGWKFATDPDVNNLRGAFISIKNLVSLYGFILENSPELIADPAGELALLDKRINGFRTGYEDARYAEMKAEIDEEAEARDKPVDPAKLSQAKAAAAEEAKQVCADLDASRAVIDFYRAEFVPADGNADPLKAFRDAVTAREMYLRACDVFESSLQAAGITNVRRIKLYMNAALCREKTGYARKAYELLGKAEKLAFDSKRDDLLWEIYYREALFLLNSGKEVDENPGKLADSYFRKAMAVVETIPALYADSPRVTVMYRDYRDTLIRRGDYREALSSYAKALSMERISSAPRMMALSSDAEMKDSVSSYLSLTAKLRDAKRALSDFIESGSADAASGKTIEANIDSVRKEIADKASDIRTRNAAAYSLVALGKDDLSSVPGKVIIMIAVSGDEAVIWKIGNGEGSSPARVRMSDTDKLYAIMSGTGNTDAKRYVIMDDGAFAVMDGIASRGLSFTWAPSISWIRTSGNSRKESPSTMATYNREKTASKISDIMICPDTDGVESLTSGTGISPVIIAFPQAGTPKMRWLAESALMNGARTAVFIPAAKISTGSGIFRTAAGRVSSLQNGSDMRVVGYDDEMVRGADTHAVAEYYEHEMNAALSRGDATGALTASLRYDAVSGTGGMTAWKSALVRAKAAEMTDNPSVIDYAREAASSGSADAVSYLIYSLLNRGNITGADAALKSAKITFPETTLYAAVIDAMRTGKSLSTITVPDASTIDGGRLQLLVARYRAINGEKPVIGRMKSLSYPLSLNQSSAAMRCGAVDVRAAGERGSLLKSIAGTDGPVQYEAVEKSSKADDPLTTTALTIALEKGISGGNFIRFVRNIDLSRVRSDADVLIALDFYETYKNGCRRANTADTASKVLDAEINIAVPAGFTRLADNALIERASKSIGEGKYDAASADLSAASRTISGSGLETKHGLISVEVALMKGDIRGGDALLSGVKPESPVDELTADLLRAYSERLKILSLASDQKKSDVRTSPAAVTGFARYEMFMKRVLSRMDSRTIARDVVIRRDLLEKGLDFLVSINHLKGDMSAAILYDEIKRQIDRWDSAGAGDGKLITSVDIAEFRTHLPADAVAVYISRNEDDIFAWVISREKITPVRIPGGYLKAKDFKTRYAVALRQMQNVYPYSVELEQLLAPAFRPVWKMKRVYIIPDKYMEQIPFEIMAKEKMLAEQVEMCYLSSIATLSYGRIVPRMRAVITGGSSEIDSIALVRAGMTAKSGDAGFAHVVTRASLVDGSIVSSDDGSEIIRGDRFSVIYLSRGIAGGGMSAVGPAAGRYGASAVIIASTSVRDVNNVVFAENFYTRIRKGENLMSSFSSAMRTTAGMTDYAHPAYWAGTRLYMNGLE